MIKKINNTLKKCIKLSRTNAIVLILIAMVCMIVYISTMGRSTTNNVLPLDQVHKDTIKVWIPTEDDIKYQDSMYSIIIQTQNEVDTIKESIDQILIKLDRIEYEDGSYDSIRYVVKPTKENQSR